MIEQLTSLDQLDVQFNGTPLDIGSAKRRLNYNDCWVDFDVAKITRKGNNALTLKVVSRNPHVLAPLVIRRVDTLISYR